MKRSPPILLICDGVSWRLDLFRQALERVFEFVAPFDGRVELAFRTRDDLALVVVRTARPTPTGFEAALVFEARLPGFRRFEGLGAGPDTTAPLQRALDQADVIARVPTAGEVVAILRGRLGMLSDARAAVRLRVTVPVRFELEGAWVEAVTSDLTALGLFVATDRLPPLNEPVRLELFVGSGRGPLEVRAQVVRHTLDGFGARLDFSPRLQEELYRRVRAIRLPAPADPATVAELGGKRTGTARLEKHELSHAISESLASPTARVLVAIDDEERRLALAAGIQSAGFETLRAASADETLTMLVEELLALDLLVVAESLRNVPVEDLLFRIREVGGETHLPIVVVAREGNNASVLRSAGADLVLPADESVETTVAAIRAFLEERRREHLG